MQVDKKDLTAFLFRNLDDYDHEKKRYPTDNLHSVNDLEEVPDGDDDDDDIPFVTRKIFEEAEDWSSEKGARQQYLHFGVENALMGKSPGVVHHRKYAETIRILHEVNGVSMTAEMLDMVYPTQRALLRVCIVYSPPLPLHEKYSIC